MDIRTERMNGLTATQALKAQHQTARVVILTADDDDLRHAAREAGASGYSLMDDLRGLIQWFSSVASKAASSGCATQKLLR